MQEDRGEVADARRYPAGEVSHGGIPREASRGGGIRRTEVSRGGGIRRAERYEPHGAEGAYARVGGPRRRIEGRGGGGGGQEDR